MTIIDDVRDSIVVDGRRSIETKRLVVDGQNDVQEIVLYWFKVGDSFTSNYWKQQVLIAWKSFLGQPASSALIRISARFEENDQMKCLTELKDFARQISPLIQQYLP